MLKVEGRDDGLDVIGEIGQRIAARRRGRSAPAPLIDRDGAELGRQPFDHVPPSSRRTAPVVQEDDCGRPGPPLLDVQFDAIRRDHHSESPLIDRMGCDVAAPSRRGPTKQRYGQAVALTMNAATAAGWESMGTWLLLTCATVAFIRAAIRCCSACGMA